MKRSALLTASLLAFAFALPSTDALACGACFSPPTSPTVVSGHRMVLSISPTRTVLWDQIQYQGDPTEFAWVLPIKPGAEIEASTSAFFEVLEATTQRTVQGPAVNCGGGSGFGCGLALAASDSAGASAEGTPVTVVHQGTVGPYETVTLHSSTPGALNQWLAQHDFNVDAASQPVIDQYVTEGFDFIALRLQPGKGVSQMTPVRVVSPGASPSMPLRMVAIGTGASVPIVLYVIGEGRWATQNFPAVNVDEGLVTWDFATNTSNYADLRAIALEKEGGRGFLTAYATKGALTSYLGFDPVTYEDQNFARAYFQQAVKNGESQGPCGTVLDAPTSGLVKDPCPAGVEPGSPECIELAPGEVDVNSLVCGGADDIGAATLGMHLEDVWVTRLEAVLPRGALDTDLVLKAADEQQPVSRTLQASLSKNGDQACGAAFVPFTLGDDAPNERLPIYVAVALGLAGASLLARRRAATPTRAR
ncbi:MAG: DUF2330 domain-containing protein [Polyangiaceae bacterium]